MQHNLQYIPFLFYNMSHLIFPDTVHVKRFSDMFLVEIDIRNGI